MLLGYSIPSGAELALNLHAMHRLHPDRPALPFGAGSRVCPGRRLAYVEARVAVAAVLSVLDVTPGGKPGKATQPAVVVSYRPRQPRLRFRAHPAQAARL